MVARMVFSCGWPWCAHRKVGEGAGQGDGTRVGMGELSLMTRHLVYSLSRCWAAEAVGLSWLTQKGAPLPSSKRFILSALDMWIWFTPETNCCQVCAPPGSGTMQDLMGELLGAACSEALLLLSCLFYVGLHPQLGCRYYSKENSLALWCVCLVDLWISLGEGSSHLHFPCWIQGCRQIQRTAFP